MKAQSFVYAACTVLEKNIELGLILLAYRHHHTLTAAIATGLSFQSAKVLATRIQIQAPAWVWTVLALIGASAISLTTSPLVQLTGCVLVTFAACSLRQALKPSPGNDVPYKSFLRFAAVACTPWYSPWITAIGIGFVCFAQLFLGAPRFKFEKVLFPIGPLMPNHIAMMLHHTHYFTYAYAVPVFFLALAPKWLALAGVHFYLGYACYDLWYVARRHPSWKVFLFGHVVAAGALLFLFSTNNVFAFTILWVITGIGAGTVKMLLGLRDPNDLEPGHNLTIYEDFGHILGIVLCTLLIVLTDAQTTAIAAGVLCVAAGLAPYSVIGIMKKCEPRTT